MDEHKQEVEESIVSDIEEHGLSVIHIPEDDYGPGYAFSIGLFKKHNHPEVMIFGLEQDSMHTIINNIGHEVKQKRTFVEDEIYDDLLGDYDCTFKTVGKDWYSSYLGYAKWFYKSIPFPVLQCVWPDQEGQFPWSNPKAPINRIQPLLYGSFGKDPLVQTTKKWPFISQKELAVFTYPRVIEEGSAVTLVTHDFDDGSWQFLDHCYHQESKPVLVCLEDVVSKHGYLKELSDLPYGWQAERESSDSDWIRSIQTNR